MLFAAISLGTMGFVLLTLSVLVLGLTICLYIINRRSSHELAADSYWKAEGKPPPTLLQSFKELFRNRKKFRDEFSGFIYPNDVTSSAVKKPFKQKGKDSPDDAHSLKHTIIQQQKELDKLRHNKNSVQQEESRQSVQAQKELLRKIQRLEIVLQEKEREIKQAKQYEAIAREMSTRFETLYDDFGDFQQKLGALEKEAARAATLTLELEDAKEMYERARNELSGKQVKLDELFNEVQRLQELLNDTEDKLQEANQQRQQLIKKVRYLEDINAEFQAIAETNKKMQTELRRISELESMLSMMTEEGKYLLRRYPEE